jgi:hypothetical protein
MLSEDEFKLYAIREKSYIPDPALEKKLATLRIEGDDLEKSLSEAQQTETAETETLVEKIQTLLVSNGQQTAETIAKQMQHKSRHVSPERLEYYHGYTIKSEADMLALVSSKLREVEAGGLAA